MKSTNSCKVLLVLAAVAVLAAPSVWAQRRQRPRYDASAEITVKGTVEEVRERGPEGRTRTLLVVKTGDQTLNVSLGPSSFVADSKIKFAQGDEVEVTGAKMNFRGNEMLMARTVKKGDQTLTLRDKNGRPKWSQGRRRRGGGSTRGRDRSSFTGLREEGFPLNLNPELVPAEEAPLADGDMVMGIVHNGQVRAYPVNYMNGPTNEVVNDTLGGTPVAASW